MALRAKFIVFCSVFSVGCATPQVQEQPVVNHAVAPYQQYVSSHVNWSSIQRIVLMPIANQTTFAHVGEEIQVVLATELQRAGRFETVVATHADDGARAQDVFTSGQFDEIELLRVAREYQADAILFVNVTQYHPYTRPRIGLSMLLVDPAEGVVISSTNGMWDTRETNTANQAVAYFKQTQSWPRSLLNNERVFESPNVFQTFVCQQVASTLGTSPSGIIPAAAMMMPPAMPMGGEAVMSHEGEVPPSPPASAADFP